MRTLARGSAEAARETGEKIAAAVQRGQRASVASGAVTTSVRSMERTAAAIAGEFTNIAGRVASLGKLVDEIATAAAEETRGVEAIATTVARLEAVTQGNASAAEQNAAVSHQLQTEVAAIEGAAGTIDAILSGSPAPARPAGSVQAHVSSGPRHAPARPAAAGSAR